MDLGFVAAEVRDPVDPRGARAFVFGFGFGFGSVFILGVAPFRARVVGVWTCIPAARAPTFDAAMEGAIPATKGRNKRRTGTRYVRIRARARV